ncbi:MAG TPA: MEDS domain-containing protein, partial [Bacteroidia bacterium]
MKKKQTFTICGETLTGPMHICAFFDSREEQYRTLLPWIQEGLNGKEEVINILHADLHCDHCMRLSKAGVAIEEATKNGQLKILASEDTYLHGGAFAAERMVNLLEQAL